jgi:single-stranded-DNA-specific exonuclease
MHAVTLTNNSSLSVKNFKWSQKILNERRALAIATQFSLAEIIARLLSLREIEMDKLENYLKPTIKNFLPNPFHLLDMEKGVARIIKAIKSHENIVIFGDYDVDGATSSALLKRFFSLIGVKVDIYIPDRIKEGYGPNIYAMNKLKERNTNLVITVDCGTVSFDAIFEANKLGIDVIVIDHHLGGEILPDAAAVINPNRLDEISNYKYLAAVGVSFLVAVAINSRLNEMGYFNDMPKPDLLSLLDLVALGTVCDMVPLEGLNRAFVTQGLKVMAKRSNLGLRTLLDLASVVETPNCYHLGFIIGPRINAGGRVGESDLGANILSSDDNELIYNIAKRLSRHNEERKSIEILVLEEAMIQAEKIDQDSSVIVVCSDNWHPGVIGIVASRLKEKFNKPTAVISILQDGMGKASCRSVKGIDFGSAIFMAKSKNIIKDGGGHAMAGGFSIAKDNINKMHDFLDNHFKEKLTIIKAEAQYLYDTDISCASVSLPLIEMIESIGPYGSGAPEPRFRISNCYIIKVSIVASAHIICIIGENFSNKTVKATAFRALDTDLGNFLLNARGKTIDLIGYLRINRWNGYNKPEMIIEDVITCSI